MLKQLEELRKAICSLGHQFITKNLKGYEAKGRDTLDKVPNKEASVLVQSGAGRVAPGSIWFTNRKAFEPLLLGFYEGFIHYVGSLHKSSESVCQFPHNNLLRGVGGGFNCIDSTDHVGENWHIDKIWSSYQGTWTVSLFI